MSEGRRVGAALLLGLLANACDPKKSVAPAPSASVEVVEDAAPPDAGPRGDPYEGMLPRERPPTKVEADAILNLATDAAKGPSPDCDSLAGAAMLVAFTAAPPAPEKLGANEAAWATIARCAEKKRDYRFMLGISVPLSEINESAAHPELVGRALLGCGETAAALGILRDVAAAHGDDADSLAALAKTECAEHAWTECLAHADAAVKAIGSADAGTGQDTLRLAQEQRRGALLHLGKFDDVDAGAAKTSQIVVDAQTTPRVPLSAYHLYGHLPALGALASVGITNLGTTERSLKVEAEIPQITDRASETVQLPPGQRVTVTLTPKLAATFEPSTVLADRETTVAMRVLAEKVEQPVWQDAAPVIVSPRDVLPLAVGPRPTTELAAAWVSSSSKAVQEMVAQAGKRMPVGTLDAGASGPAAPKAKALYEEMQAQRSGDFVPVPLLLSEKNPIVRPLRMGDVMTSKTSTVLDGVFLFASALRAMGVRPLLFLAPGRAMVGFFASKADTLRNRAVFLDLSAIKEVTFEKARDTGEAVFTSMREARLFVSFRRGPPLAYVVDVDALAKRGISPGTPE